MTAKARKAAKRKARRERAKVRKRSAAMLRLYRSRRLPGETARQHLVRTLRELQENPLRFVTMPEPARFYPAGET